MYGYDGNEYRGSTNSDPAAVWGRSVRPLENPSRAPEPTLLRGL